MAPVSEANVPSSATITAATMNFFIPGLSLVWTTVNGDSPVFMGNIAGPHRSGGGQDLAQQM